MARAPRAVRRAVVRRWTRPAVRSTANSSRAATVPATGRITLTLASTTTDAATRTGDQRARAAGSGAAGARAGAAGARAGAAGTGPAAGPAPAGAGGRRS